MLIFLNTTTTKNFDVVIYLTLLREKSIKIRNSIIKNICIRMTSL